MIEHSILFACGPGPEFVVLYFAFIGLLVLTGALFLGNICLLFALRDGLLLCHGIGLATYALLALALWTQVQNFSGNYPVIVGGVLALPVIVIGHFIWLVRLVRRERRALRAQAELS